MSELPPLVQNTIRLYRLAVSLGLTGWTFTGNLAGEEATVAQYTGDYECRKLHAIWTRSPVSAPAQDVMVTTHHFLNITSGAPDNTWITSDYTQVESAFTTMWGSLKPSWPDTTRLLEYRWYADGPAFKPFGDDSSPLLRATSVNTAGSGTATPLPPQIAVSVTEVTAARYSTIAREGRPSQLRHRWGRFYLPAPTVGVVGSATGAQAGRLGAATQTIIADAAQVFYNACRAGSNLVPIMYSPTTGNAWSVDEIHVDDIFDVVRSRRYETPLSRAVRTLT